MPNQPYPFHFFLHCGHLIEERLRIKLAPLEITPRQARVLDALGRMGQASQVQLADEFGLSAASMSTMTTRLLAAGLIEKRVDAQELRSNVLKLSEHGSSLLKQIYQVWRQMDQEIEAAIGTENAIQLATITHKLRNAFGGFTPGESESNAN
ncbi:MarR family winged helix-turn-helix transcriptional regulator [Psychrobacter sp. 2Y5]|uniref:MarR family winged helix-turn-helix transcriptional regulator n=1 Tax=unclassified Psychrobacter TaxID=196806 RepID=UPI003F46EE53